MSENWKSYFCRVNGELASIMLDLGLRGAAPLGDKAWLLCVWVYFKHPSPDGLSDGNEAPVLFKIEDALSASLRSACAALLSGRITTAGRREFYFYGETKEGFADSVKKALKGFKGYRLKLGAQEDRAWAQYLNVLYPQPVQLQEIADRDAIEVLRTKGDVLTVPREVRHWIYFSSEESRNRFRDAVLGEGYSFVYDADGEEDLPLGVVIAKHQPVDESSIIPSVRFLLEKAEQFGGDYDGWETAVITQ